MDNLTQFLQTNKLDYKFSHNQDEIKILKFLLQNYLEDNPSLKISFIIDQIFNKDKSYSHLKYITNFKNLANLGFVILESNQVDLLLYHQEVELSEYFFKILEDINSDEIKLIPYEDTLSYLKDKFYLIDQYYKRANLLHKDLINKRINSIEQMIDQKIKITKIPLIIEQIFKKYNLDKNEEIIFLALLKQEYLNDFEMMRYEENLINLISINELEKFENKKYLLDDAKLIKFDLIEEGINFDLMHKSFFIQEDILKSIINSKKSQKVIQKIVDDSEIFELIHPSVELNDVVVNNDIKEFFSTIIKRMDKKVLLKLKNWGIKSNDIKAVFYGPAGTGKTMSAIALAKALKRDILSFDCSKILSKYVGESEQNVRKIFDEFNEIKKSCKKEPILLLNEADQFFSSRIELAGGSSEKMHNQMQNIFLEQFEKFDGIIIATTNFIQNFDKAFSRRFNYKIEFKRPNYEERCKIWEKILPKNAKYDKEFDIKKLASFDLSGAEIALVFKNTALEIAIDGDEVFDNEKFIKHIKNELNSQFDKDKKVGLL